jgi:hypothetical protein
MLKKYCFSLFWFSSWLVVVALSWSWSWDWFLSLCENWCHKLACSGLLLLCLIAVVAAAVAVICYFRFRRRGALVDVEGSGSSLPLITSPSSVVGWLLAASESWSWLAGTGVVVVAAPTPGEGLGSTGLVSSLLGCSYENRTSPELPSSLFQCFYY